MPLYDYMCTRCGNVQEEAHSFKDSPCVHCTACGAKSEKAILTAPLMRMANVGNDGKWCGNAEAELNKSKRNP